MMTYPLIAKVLNPDPAMTVVFFGGIIHDVAQVVGAGYLISPKVAETATFVKLFRVALLMPVVLMFSLVFRGRSGESGVPGRGMTPGSLIGFVALVMLHSAGFLGGTTSNTLSDLPRRGLLVAISALEIKTSFAERRTLG